MRALRLVLTPPLNLGVDQVQLERVRVALQLDDLELLEVIATTRGSYGYRAWQRLALELAGRVAYVDRIAEHRASLRGWWVRGVDAWHRSRGRAELHGVLEPIARSMVADAERLREVDLSYARVLHSWSGQLLLRGRNADCLLGMRGVLRVASVHELRTAPKEHRR